MSSCDGGFTLPNLVAQLSGAERVSIVSAVTIYNGKNDSGSTTRRFKNTGDYIAYKKASSLANATAPTVNGLPVRPPPTSVLLPINTVPPAECPVPPPSGTLFREPSVNVDVDISTNSPFASGRSYSFDGTSTYLNVVSDDSWNLGTDDFTIEWFQYQTDTNTYPRIFALGDLSFNTVSIGCSIEGGLFYTWFPRPGISFGQLNPSPPATTPYKSIWQHFAIVRRSGVLRVYRNGQQFGGNVSNTYNMSNSLPLYFGVERMLNDTSLPNAYYGGLLTNIRIVKGLAVYTGPFTTPSSALTVAAAANPYGGSNTVAIPNGYTKLLFTP